MFFDCVEIINFRRYYGKNHFNLDFSDEKNVTTFVADNNAGKSSLVNALSWGLYGDELHDSKDRSEPYCNVEILDEAEKTDENPKSAKVEVKIKFYDIDDKGDKEYFTITRILKYYKYSNADWTPEIEEEVIFEDNLANTYRNEYAEMKINDLFPEDMFKYFFFNGASISNYFDYDQEDTFNLKDSIDHVSQLDLIKKVSEKLDNTYKKLENDLKNNKTDDKDELLDEYYTKKDHLRTEEKKKEDYEKKRDDSYKKKLEYDLKLKQIKATKVKKLIDDREWYKSKKKELKKDIASNTEKYQNLVLELFPICVLFKPLYESYITVGDSIENNAIPNEVKEQILKIIEDEGKCICGLDLNEHPECLDVVKNKFKEESVENSLYRKEYDYIGDVLKKLRKIPNIESLKNTINKDEEHLELINSKLSKISNKLLDSKKEKVKQYENSRNKYENLHKKYSEYFNSTLTRIENLNEDIKDLKEKINKIDYKNSKSLKIQSKMDFCNDIIDVMGDLKNGVRTQIRHKVNEKTKDQFTTIKSEEYGDVLLDDQYDVQIIENGGRTVIPADLSDGTENLLALSFIMALHSIKGIDFPLVIDAPFEKLDRTSRIDFVDGLHEFTKNRQVIFLFTDSQYTDEVRSHMLKIVLDEFKLIKDGPKKTVINHVV